jgi:curli biogenesis system outer membrane secretion channel CsgG
MERRASLYLACAALLAGCSTAPILGGDDPITKGAASGQQAVAATEQLERCTEPLGTVGFAEAADDPYVPIVQMLVQQSNCFIVVERGRAYNQIDFERQLKAAGLTSQSAEAGRKMLAADYTMVPSVTFAEPSGFGLSTGLGGLFGRRGSNLDTSAQVQALGASTTLRLIDNASGAQIVAAQGSAKNYNLGAGVGILGGMLAGVNAYASTPQGKIVAAAFLDAYNKLVQAARQYRPQQTSGGAGQGGRLQGPQ